MPMKIQEIIVFGEILNEEQMTKKTKKTIIAISTNMIFLANLNMDI